MRAHGNDSEPWKVTLFKLVEDLPKYKRLPLFVGKLRVKRTAVLDTRATARMISWLSGANYYDGDSGCFSESVGIRVERGGETLDMVENCAHLYLTDNFECDASVSIEGEMMLFIDELEKANGFWRAVPGPAVPGPGVVVGLNHDRGQ